MAEPPRRKDLDRSGEPCLLLRMLGPFGICLDGRTIPLKPQTLRLLALLAVNANKSVSRTAIIDVVWDGEIPEVRNEANQIQVHIKAIRDALACGGVPRNAVEALGSGRYRLHSPPLVTDFGVFNSKAAEAEGLLTAGSLTHASQVLTEALAAWSGPALDGLSGRFAEAESARLEEQKLNALQRRIDIDLWRGRYREQVAELAKLVRSRPGDDSLRVRLMLALHGAGRSSEAIDAFHDGRRILVEDLGIQPGTALRSAQRAILGGQPVNDILGMLIPLAYKRSARKAARPPRPARCLPAAVADFTGRVRELGELDQILARSQPASVMVISALSGTGGVGKTALAVRWAHQVSDRFPDGQLYLDLRGYGPDPAMEPLEALGLLIQQLRAPEPLPPEAEARAQIYRSLLAGKQALVVLDNAATAEQVRSLLPGSSRCMALVTSRRDLSGLVAKDGARRLDMGLLPLEESVALLRRIIGNVRVNAELGAATEVAQLCCRLPLALRIAAERALARPALRLEELASQLAAEQDRLEVLATPDGDPATATRIVFSWSYRRLTADAQRGFRLLGLASGTDIGIPAAAALCDITGGQMRRVLDELASEHLLEEHRPGRYRCHDLLRRYAAECAQADETDQQRSDAVCRLLTWYVAGADTADRVILPRTLHIPRETAGPACAPALRFSGHSQALTWCETEWGNLTAAIRQASTGGYHAIAWKLPAALWGFFYLRKPWAAWIGSYEIGLASARQIHDAFGEAWMLYGLGTAHWSLRQLPAAIGYYERSLAVWRIISHKWGEAMTLNNMAAAHCGLGQFQTALDIFSQALNIRRQLGDERGQAQSMINIGSCYSDVGDYPRALAQLREALQFSHQIGYPYGIAVTTHNLGAALADLGQFTTAVEHLRSALDLRRELGDEQGQAETSDRLGQAQQQTGAISDARASWEQALEIFDALGDPQAVEVRARLEQMHL